MEHIKGTSVYCAAIVLIIQDEGRRSVVPPDLLLCQALGIAIGPAKPWRL
jgi:hypothetical protein